MAILLFYVFVEKSAGKRSILLKKKENSWPWLTSKKYYQLIRNFKSKQQLLKQNINMIFAKINYLDVALKECNMLNV